MRRLEGHWYDGRTSAKLAAALVPQGQTGVRVQGLEDGQPLLIQDRFVATVSPRLGSTPRIIKFPEGQQFVSDDNQGVDELLKALGRPRPGLALVHALEAHKGYVALFLAAILLLVWAAVGWGLPWAAQVIAFRLPPTVLHETQEQVLAALDRSLFSPSQLPAADQERLLGHFQPALRGQAGDEPRVVFRQGGALGPNALALPAGAIVFTDELVKLAQHDDELLAVLAHEIGHVVERHSLRTLVQGSLLAFLVLGLTGDLSGTSQLFLGLPVFLTEMHYSRQFERQADEHALRFLCARGIRTERFADIMTRLSAEVDKKRGTGDQRWGRYFSSHPDIAQRLLAFQGGGACPGRP